MKPTIGRDVHVLGIQSNGSDVHPAKITRVWGEGDTTDAPVTVNLIVFPDNGAPVNHTSIKLFDTREKAEAARSEEAVVAFVPYHGDRAEPGR